MRICFICSEYPPATHGGIGTMTQMLGRSLVRAGYQVRVAGVYGPDGGVRHYEEDHGVEIYRLRYGPNRFWPVARYRLFQTVAGWARKGEIDLIEAPDYQGWAAGWRSLPVPVVVRMHGSSTYFAAELGQRIDGMTFWLERAGLRRADFVCSVSKYTGEKSQELFGLGSRPAIVYNFVEVLDQLPNPDRSGEQVIFSGTLTRKKGVLPLIAAWPRVREARANAELHVFGKDGKTEDGHSMKAFLLSQLGPDAQRSVHFHGHLRRDQLLEVLRCARVAVFPSYAEAFAMAPLEAMAQGCATIYTGRGSGPEVIEHEHDGLLVDPDHPAEIAQAIVRLLADKDLARRLGEAGHRRVQQRFSRQVGLKENEEFYTNCLRAFGQSRTDSPQLICSGNSQ